MSANFLGPDIIILIHRKASDVSDNGSIRFSSVSASAHMNLTLPYFWNLVIRAILNCLKVVIGGII